MKTFSVEEEAGLVYVAGSPGASMARSGYKRRIRSVTNTRKITRAMEIVAA